MAVRLLVFGATLGLSACSPRTDNQMAQSVLQLKERVGQLEARMSKIEASPGPGDAWVLWYSEENLRGPTWRAPTADGAYPTKDACLAAAVIWSIPGGKQLGSDPFVVQNKDWRVTRRCLPKGVEMTQRR